MGAVDYVPVLVVPEVLRAKVRIFAELFRTTRELGRLNSKLERHVAEHDQLRARLFALAPLVPTIARNPSAGFRLSLDFFNRRGGGLCGGRSGSFRPMVRFRQARTSLLANSMTAPLRQKHTQKHSDSKPPSE
jgi:hypothetical protein